MQSYAALKSQRHSQLSGDKRVPLLNQLKGTRLQPGVGHGCKSNALETPLGTCGRVSEAFSWQLSAKSPSETERQTETGETGRERQEEREEGPSSGPCNWRWEALTAQMCWPALPCSGNEVSVSASCLIGQGQAGPGGSACASRCTGTGARGLLWPGAGQSVSPRLTRPTHGVHTWPPHSSLVTWPLTQCPG